MFFRRRRLTRSYRPGLPLYLRGPSSQPSYRYRRRGRLLLTARLVLVLLVCGALFCIAQVLRPVPNQVAVAIPLAPVTAPGTATAGPAAKAAAAAKEAAVSVSGLPGRQAFGPQTPVPIASLAKIMTAYVVLHQHPLRPGAAGPDITITPADVSAFHSDAAKGEAVLAVQSGELLTERQLLEALLVGSAGNAADTLARWDAGTPPAFLAAMNRTAARLGLGATRYADDSGETPGTVSTASNQLTLTMLAMSDPVFAQIVAEPAARFPFAGVMQNFNYDVGRYGVLGVKTGSDAAAGGCWAFAIRRVIVGQPRIVYGVVLGVAPTGAGLIQPALQTGLGLAEAMSGTVQHFTLVTAGAPVGYLTAPWRGTHVRLVTAAALSGLASAGATVQLSIQLHQPTGTSIRAGQVLGRLQAQGLLGNASAPIIAADSAAGPSLGWRLAQQPW